MKRLAIQLLENESIITSGFATRPGFFIGKNGRLVLTNKRILFVNRRGTKTFASYHLSEVIFVERGRIISGIQVIFVLPLLLALLIKQGVRITLRDQTTQHFYVWNRDRWIGLIENERGNARKAER